MRDEDIDVVRGISYFSTVTEENFVDLLKGAYLQRLPASFKVATKGDPADFLSIIEDGTIELSSDFNGRETTLFILDAVSTFNLSAVLTDSVYKMSARTLDKARILMIPAENVRNLLNDDHNFTLAMVGELSNRYGQAISALKEQKLLSGVERLANYLLRLHDQTNDKGQVELTGEKRSLAALLGITPEYLSRAFNTLMDYGIEVSGSTIQFTNLDKLKRLANPEA